MESCLSAFVSTDCGYKRKENSPLPYRPKLEFMQHSAEGIFFVLSPPRSNITVNTQILNFTSSSLHPLTDDESKHLASLKKNYALERLPDIRKKARHTLRLNEAGRYLIEDGSSISKGVEVLSRVNDDITAFSSPVGELKTQDEGAVEMVVATGEHIALRQRIRTGKSSGVQENGSKPVYLEAGIPQ
jgi:hypothetical protein